MARRGKLLTVVIALLVLAVAVLAIRYRRYACAVAWHCQHGNYATFPGHRIRLPLSWWEEKDTVRWEQYFLKGACTGAVCLESEIDVKRVVPAREALIPDSDRAEMEERQQVVAFTNAHAHHSSMAALSASLVKLRTPSYTLFCEKMGLRIGTRVANPSLDCGAARFRYTIMTSSFGLSSEQEIESILSTLE